MRLRFTIRSIMVLTALAALVVWFVVYMAMPTWSWRSLADGFGYKVGSSHQHDAQDGVSYWLGVCLWTLRYAVWGMAAFLPIMWIQYFRKRKRK